MNRQSLDSSAMLAAMLLLLLGLYVGSYLLVVERVVLMGDLISLEHAVTYRVGGRHSHTLFGPLHAIDRKVRPTYWQWNEPSLSVEFDAFDS